MIWQEKFFVTTLDKDYDLEPVIWFKTRKEAEKEAKEWVKKYPEDQPIFVCEVLVIHGEEKEP